jgi:hypothetical protein
MQIHSSPDAHKGELPVNMNPGDDGPFGILHLGPDVYVNIDSDEDADRIIRAAATLKAMRAMLGTAHPYEAANGFGYGACAKCGMLPGWRDHNAPCPSIAPHAGRQCTRGAGHDGQHESGMVVWGPGVTEAAAETTGCAS